MQRIIFWQDMLSILQSALIRNLADKSEIAITLVTREEVPEDRLKLGWYKPNFGNTEVIINPDEYTMDWIINRDQKQSIHIFSGAQGYPFVWTAFQRCAKTKARMGMMSESYDWRGLKGKLRMLRSRWNALNYWHRIDFILAIGHLGVNCYQKSGYLKPTIFPFGYFVETPSLLQNDIMLKKQTDSTTVHLGFIGQLIKRKGVDLLLKALADLKHLDWHLKIIGNGPDRAEFERLCDEEGILKRVSFLDAINNKEATRILSEIDLFILPSRWDGWGAVINEALMCGTLVICSNYCGAADLIGNSTRGEIVAAGSVESLRSALERRIQKGPLDLDERKYIREWARCISGESAATYLKNIFAHVYENSPRPFVPWLK